MNEENTNNEEPIYIIAALSVPMRVEPEPVDAPMTPRIFYWYGGGWTLEYAKVRRFDLWKSVHYWAGKLEGRRPNAWPFLTGIRIGQLTPDGSEIVVPGSAAQVPTPADEPQEVEK